MVADIAEDGDQFGILGHGVEGIAMDDEVAAMGILVNVAVDDLQAAEAEGEEAIEDIVVVAAEVDDAGFALVNFFEDEAQEAGMGAFPSAAAAEGPSVDNIPVEEKGLAVDVFEEVIHLIDLAIGGTQMDIGEDDGPEAEDGLAGFP